jgi:hypothetical protein
VTAANLLLRRHHTTVSAWAPQVIGVATVAAVVGGIGWAATNATYDTFAGAIVIVVLVAVTFPIARLLAMREPDPRIARLILIAPFLKLAATLLRFAVAYVVYDGVADAAIYHREGTRLAESLREGIFTLDLGRAFVGTGFIRLLTGIVYTITGPTQLGAFFVFSWLGFWGLYLFYRAFAIACPDGDKWRYARLIFVLPSLLFWPSSIGKEAWMCLGLGVIAYGAARLLAGRHGGLVALAIGISMTACVRPHVGAAALMGVLAAYIARRTPVGRRRLTAPIGKLLGLVVLGIGLVVVIGQAEDLLGVDSFNSEAIDSARQETTLRTSAGGSEFETDGGASFDPSRFPAAILSVLFRPLPWEASNVQSLIAAIEGMAMLCLFAFGWRRLIGAVRAVLRTPYVVLAVTYTVLFVYGFSSFSNFGILTRQRVQVLPFVLVLVCLPPFSGGRRDWRELLRAGPEPSRVRDADG